jgi:hypothetical protein
VRGGLIATGGSPVQFSDNGWMQSSLSFFGELTVLEIS